MEALEKLKKDKRSLKSSLTKYLNELAVEAPKKEKNYGEVARHRKQTGRIVGIIG